ncbi:DUF2975 domain-containing protein [Companilactobacillus ginsenosidimutans]|nr:DUF2975 domain-containing protein [Companilactobacillus ginsenosidimutans]
MSNWPILTDLLGAGMYLAAIVFYLVLYQGYRLLKMIDHKSAFSNVAVQALRWIKIEAYTICGLMILELPIFYIFADRDDSPGMLLVGIVFAGAPLVIAIFASVLQKLLHQAIEIKAENDLTI